MPVARHRPRSRQAAGEQAESALRGDVAGGGELAGIYDPGPAALSGAGAHLGAGGQLVDAFYAPGDPRQARRGDHDAALVAARPCPADAPRPPNGRDDHQLARAADEGSFAAGQRLSAMAASNCGAVDPRPTLATDSKLDFSPIPPRKSPRNDLLCHRCPLATAVFRLNGPSTVLDFCS